MPTGARPNPPPHSMHMVILGNVDGFPWANTFWVRNGNAQVPTQNDFTTFAANFGVAYWSHMKATLSEKVVGTEVTGLYYDSAGAELAAAVSNVTAGLSTGAVCPANVALCIGWRVQQHYRGGHPRTYLPGVPVTALLNSRSFVAAYASNAAQAASQFHNDVNATTNGAIQGCKLGIVSFVLRKEWRSPPVFRDFVYPSAHADQRIDSMRRRLGRDIPP